jgi:hypothetical protein
VEWEIGAFPDILKTNPVRALSPQRVIECFYSVKVLDLTVTGK